MIIILSPAKRMALCSTPDAQTTPCFLLKTQQLAVRLKEYDPGKLAEVLQIGSSLAMKAFMDYQDKDLFRQGTAALYAYRGLVFSALHADSLTEEDQYYAQRHLRILSGFYGLLKPMDGIWPYRLEMGQNLPEVGSIYNFWGDQIAREIFSETDTVLNLASAEYSKAIMPHVPRDKRVVSCEFYCMHKGRWRMITTEVKKARGKMTRWLIENRIAHPLEAAEFDQEGYRFDRERSTDDVFRFYKD